MVKIEKRSQNEFAVVVEGKGDKRQYIVSLDDYRYPVTQGKIGKEELKENHSNFCQRGNPKSLSFLGSI